MPRSGLAYIRPSDGIECGFNEAGAIMPRSGQDDDPALAAARASLQ